MIFNEISILADAYYYCRSNYYSAHGTLNRTGVLCIRKGVNVFRGDIDSEGWALSYLISMGYDNKDLFIYDLKITKDGDEVSLSEISKVCCYLDISNKLFSSQKSVRDQVERGLTKSKTNLSTEDIRNLFGMESFRFDSPIGGTGHECYKAMAAIGYSYGKDIFCFPWFSLKLYDSFHYHLSLLPGILESAGKTCILPLGTGDADLKMTL